MIRSLDRQIARSLEDKTEEEILPEVEMVLIMTVNPGFGGQKFVSNMTHKILRLKQIIDAENLDCDIEVDGGINPETSKIVRDAGANILVAGSAIYGSSDIADAIKNIRGQKIILQKNLVEVKKWKQ